MAKLVIEVLAKDLKEILGNLEFDSDFSNSKCTLEVGITESKKNFEYLAKSDKIVNWDFISENNLEEDLPVEDYSPQSSLREVGVFEDKPRLLEIYNYFNHPTFMEDEDGLLKLIYISWVIKQKSPARWFTLSTLSSLGYLDAHGINVGILFFLPKTTREELEEYYKDKPFEFILEDIINKLHKNWNNLDRFPDFDIVINNLLNS